MPYITEQQKVELSDVAPRTPGELTYVITMALKRYILTHGLNYQTCSDILGSLDGARLDFIWRKVVPYEKKKEQENGDVWST